MNDEDFTETVDDVSWILNVIKVPAPTIFIPFESRIEDSFFEEGEAGEASWGDYAYNYRNGQIYDFTYTCELFIPAGELVDYPFLECDPINKVIKVADDAPPGTYSIKIIATLNDEDNTTNEEMIWTVNIDEYVEPPPPPEPVEPQEKAEDTCVTGNAADCEVVEEEVYVQNTAPYFEDWDDRDDLINVVVRVGSEERIKLPKIIDDQDDETYSYLGLTQGGPIFSYNNQTRTININPTNDNQVG